MPVTVRSFAKINLGLAIGALRPDGFHGLRTVYHTIALHDVLRIAVVRGTGIEIEIRCRDPRVPKDESNTCYGITERAMAALKSRGRVIIEIEKRLPVQGGLGGASANAVATLLALERCLKKAIPLAEKLRIAAEVGSDPPLFLIGGAVLGVGRGEEVYPLPDLPAAACVVAMPDIAVSTPKAFADWDRVVDATRARVGTVAAARRAQPDGPRKLTAPPPFDRMNEFNRRFSAWLSAAAGVPVNQHGGRAETPLLDLVHTGIENDFERVVFPQYPALCELKQALLRAGAVYASLSGSGSAVYGLFRARRAAQLAAAHLRKQGTRAAVTAILGRRQYWQKIFDC